MQHSTELGKLFWEAHTAAANFPALDALLVIPPLCLAGLLFLALVGQGLASRRKRSAYGKCASQLVRLGSLLGLVMTIGGGIALAMRYETLLALDIENFTAREVFLTFLLASSWLCVTLSTLLTFLCMGLRQWLSDAVYARQTCCLFAATAAAAAVYALLLHLHASVAPDASAPFSLFLPNTEHFLTMSGQAPLAALSLAGGCGALWLLLRRAADDYGRDHYNLVIPWCASWGCNAWLLLWLFASCRAVVNFLHIHDLTNGRPDWFPLIYDAAGLLVLLPPCLLWTIIRRSSPPTRAKIAIFLAPLWAAACLALLYG